MSHLIQIINKGITDMDTELKLLDLPRSNVAGVTWVKKTNRWQVSISYDNKRYHLGYTKDLTSAVIIRYVFEQIIDCDMYVDKSSAEIYLTKHRVLKELKLK